MELDYDELVFLDAEALAEGGIGAAYAELLPRIRSYAPVAETVAERLEPEAGRYAVVAGGKEYVIYSPQLPDDEGESWGRATHALFDIVNTQLAGTTHRFYAVNGGNDLAGIFLTPEEAESSRTSLERKEDWPYLPSLEHPWYGMHH